MSGLTFITVGLMVADAPSMARRTFRSSTAPVTRTGGVAAVVHRTAAGTGNDAQASQR